VKSHRRISVIHAVLAGGGQGRASRPVEKGDQFVQVRVEVKSGLHGQLGPEIFSALRASVP
jgi:hypothetical protein